jgi:hypothetical protein
MPVNAVMSYGLSGYQAALSKINSAAGQISRIQNSTIPAASPNDAQQPRAATEALLAPPPPEQSSGRAPSSSNSEASSLDAKAEKGTSVPQAVVDIIEARREAQANATSIRVAGELLGEILDLNA